MGWSGFPPNLTWDRILSLAHVYHTGSQHTGTGTCLTHHREEAPPQKAFKDRFGRNIETAMLSRLLPDFEITNANMEGFKEIDTVTTVADARLHCLQCIKLCKIVFASFILA